MNNIKEKRDCRKITLSGLAGTGKSTVGNILAEKLNCKFYSAGNKTREYARQEKNMDINEFQNYCNKNPQADEKLDNMFKSFGENNSCFVMDYRLGFYFIPSSYSVLLTVSQIESAKRISKQNRTEFENQSFSKISDSLNVRNNAMRKRFLENYEVDFLIPSHYDIVVNTDNKTQDEVAEEIIAKINKKGGFM